MNLLVWNCQGAASRKFRRILGNFTKVYKPEIVCLLETKVSGAQANDICCRLGFDEWLRVEAFGFSGGIWVLWNLTILVDVLITHPQFVVAKVSHSGSPCWFLSFVYGSPNITLRRELFSELSRCNVNSMGGWLSVGDYNSVVNSSETSSTSNFSLNRCADFNHWIFSEGLLDLGFTGSSYTWTRGLDTSTFRGARLDRALCNTDWRLLFPKADVTHLPRIGSDHNSLLVRTNPTGGGGVLRSFKFNAAWLTQGFPPVY
ncbi:PREDICTED: uncharacterized protein LOC109148673 [Ipomoea nil]|uniref:uncharacterized protein LOC109148673 n=1 Tax=Ipomoea nil TaxID=35883 RepID=UPI000901B861|nr:PREDICTED: uncharacterized protein LOC109148673 [Ipomoea nil]